MEENNRNRKIKVINIHLFSAKQTAFYTNIYLTLVFDFFIYQTNHIFS